MLHATRLTAEIPQTHLSLCKTLWAATVRVLDVASPMPGTTLLMLKVGGEWGVSERRRLRASVPVITIHPGQRDG